MSNPRIPGRDLRLERLGDGLRPAHLGDVAHSATTAAQAKEILAAYEALIDAVFLAPGAAEWLHGLGLTVAAFVASKAGKRDAARDAIRPA